jgi:Zn-dependent oligopeptidase
MTISREQLKAKLIAVTLTHREYRYLRNAVRVLRLSGAPLDPEQEKKVKEFEAAIAAYEEQRCGQGANG